MDVPSGGHGVGGDVCEGEDGEEDLCQQKVDEIEGLAAGRHNPNVPNDRLAMAMSDQRLFEESGEPAVP